LIVTCEQCATQFQLDDAKVPVGGVRVRCSRCKHAFFIEPLGAELPQSPLDRAAQAALDAHAPPGPEASEDLVDADGDTDSDFGDGEDFSAGDDLAAGNDLADDSDFGDANDLSDGRSSDASATGERPSGRNIANPNDSDESISDESDWEFNEDRFRGDHLGAEDPDEAHDAAREAIDDLLDPSRSSRAPSARAGSASSREAAVLAADGDALEEDLGSPESWDLLAGDAPSSSVQGRAPQGSAAQASGELAPESQPAAATAPRESQRSVGWISARPEIEEWIEPSEPSRVLAWIARSGHALGWGVTVTLFALVAFATLGPGIGSDAQPGLGTQRLAQLEAQAIAGRWVENAAAGPLFVVSGRLVNPTAAARELGALAGVRLLDANGARMMGETAAIGPVLEPRELRESEPAALQARQLEAGRRLAATSLEPGQSLAFEAVLATVPAAAARFVLEPIPQGRGGQLAAANGSEPVH
jgi:predicted Zn finger-like uncharacterized protein